MSGNYRYLMFTDEYWASLANLSPQLTEGDAEGLQVALDDLDSRPTAVHHRLHRLDRELSDWWSLTPPSPPARLGLRILVRPERTASGGVWRIGPVTWHYRR